MATDQDFAKRMAEACPPRVSPPEIDSPGRFAGVPVPPPAESPVPATPDPATAPGET